MPIYYKDLLVNTVEYEVDEKCQEAKITGITYNDDKFCYIPETGADNIAYLICKRMYLYVDGYYIDTDVTPKLLYDAFKVLEATKGIAETDNLRFGDGEKIRGHYGVSPKTFCEFSSVVCDYSEVGDDACGIVCSQFLIDRLLNTIDFGVKSPVVSLYNTDRVVFNSVRNCEEMNLISLYDILIRNYLLDVTRSKGDLRSNFSHICELVSEACGFELEEFETWFGRVLFIDALILNEGHYLDNIYVGYDGDYHLLPYFSYTHSLCNTSALPLEQRAKHSYGRVITDNFDALGLCMKKYVPDKAFDGTCIIPVKKLFILVNKANCSFNDNSLKEMLALLGYRCNLFGIDIAFDDLKE